MNMRFYASAAIFFLLFAGSNAQAGVLVTRQILTPLIPDAESNISILVPSGVDPDKPVWAVYQLVAISADSDPQGEVVIDSSFEGVPTAINESIVIFNANNLTINKSSGTLGEQLKAQVGERSPEELKEIFGVEMYAAYAALNRKEGSYLTGSMIKTYHPDGKKELILLTSVERANGIQPVLISVVIGQGDIPAQYRNSGNSLAKDKLVAVMIAFFLGLFIWFIRRR
ncbi:MAG: hypothetical protein B0W54_11595 [Cellvibrio sp. 79]|nr:MAG: hypothetical protein B0W54_11595 [Cellvibrio sp. 79]